MPFYHAQIDWTSDPGNTVIVGLFDDAQKAIDATVDYYRTVRGAETTVNRTPDWTHPVYGTQVMELRFQRDFPAERDLPPYTVRGWAIIYETPLNMTFPGSVMAVTE